ncbi:MAG TPA: hypothetical protein VN520_18345 [Streptomyces sp.]|uniref:hypothetical protein n=1 Tax=Streptomyces sp. TaxID=1931 RepID=UPI002D15BF9A|nr:hypothetical protein [Streptomyces sp.]HWU08311.1 hypothetical protein [Streptomyces sp.]HWU08314.1 hypothetical protein [Streptomyces sp.]
MERWLTIQEDAQTAQKVLDELPELWTYKAYQESTVEEEERLARLVRRIARLLPAVDPTLAAWEAEWVSAAESSRVSAAEANARVLAAKAARDAVSAVGHVGAAPAPIPAPSPRRSLRARMRATFGRGDDRYVPPPPGWWELDRALNQERTTRKSTDDSAKHFAVMADRMTRFMKVYRAIK